MKNTGFSIPSDPKMFFATVSITNQTTQTTVTKKKDEEWTQDELLDHLKFYPIYQQDNNLTLYALIMTRHPPSWSQFFHSASEDIRHACSQVELKSSTSGRAIYPRVPDVLAAFWLTPLHTLKCIIIGQDPYPGNTKSGMPKAIGICFGSDRYSGEIPDSLVTIYRELENTVEGWTNPGHPDISCWGRQGVLLLNAALTVEAGLANAHAGAWKPFTTRLLEYIIGCLEIMQPPGIDSDCVSLGFDAGTEVCQQQGGAVNVP